MRILTLSDRVEPLLYGPSLRRVVGEVDLVLGCGDLPNYYLDYVVSSLSVPCYFVHGNHAQGAEFGHSGSDGRQAKTCLPRGCNVHGRVIHHRGLLLAGLEGSMRYNDKPRFQYTEGEMLRMVVNMAPQLLRNRLRHGRYLDILITHAPPLGIHDGPDLCHRGFAVFLTFMRWFRPRYLVHGHKHVYGTGEITQTVYQQTEVINTYGYRILDVPAEV